MTLLTSPIALTSLGIILILVLLFLVLQYVLLRSKMNRLYRKYRRFMNGDDGGTLEHRLTNELLELREMVNTSRGMLRQQELLATMQLSAFQKTGLVRYDAFEDTGDNLSFSLTLLDGRNNGIVLSSLAGQEGCRIYIKRILNGSTRESLSSEEAESLQIALNTLMPDMAPQASVATQIADGQEPASATVTKTDKVELAKK